MEKTDLPSGFVMGQPNLHDSVWIAPGARVIGCVSIGEKSSVWYNAVVRADINTITIGARSNIQDGVIIHLENENSVHISDDVTVGHGAILHGCQIGSNVVIGMGAIVLNGAIIGAGSVVGAGAVIPEGVIVPPKSLIIGVPGRVVKTYPDSIFSQNAKWAAKYIKLAEIHSKL